MRVVTSHVGMTTRQSVTAWTTGSMSPSVTTPHAYLTQRTTWLNQLFAALGLPDSSHGLDRIASCREALIMEDTIANQLVGIEDPGNRVQRVTAWREAKVLETCSIVANHVNARRSSRVVTQADHYVPR